MKAYSEDLRRKVVEALERGLNKSEAARLFGVSLSSVKRFARMAREGRPLKPRKARGKCPKIDEHGRRLLKADLKRRPAASLSERREFLKRILGVRVSESTICRLLKRLAGAEKRAVGERAGRLAEGSLADAIAGRLDARRLAFVDEMGTNTSLAPLYAWAPRGRRTHCSVPRNRGPNTTLLANMTQKRMGPCLAVEGSITRAVFEIYLEHVLAPEMRPGQMVVMDNLSAHKGERVRGLIEARGCELLYLPPYSPDLNPIEEAFAKVKALLRRAGARSREALVEALGQALEAVTVRDARSFFEHCGYRLTESAVIRQSL